MPPPAGEQEEVGKVSNVEGDLGIPATVLAAYHRAETAVGQQSPTCHLSWTLLAGIGKVESGHADQGDVTANGDVLNPIYGPALNGANNTAAMPTSAGWARAEGPMQMLPSTWQKWAVDGNGDGRDDPQNVYDAALGAGRYLCAGGRDLSTGQGQQQAILSYNPSAAYYQLVASWVRAYQGGASSLPDEPGAVDPDTRARGGHPTNPTVSPPPASTPRPDTAQPDTPRPAPPTHRDPIPAPTRPEPKPVPILPIVPRLLPPPTARLLPVPPGADTPKPLLPPHLVHGLTDALDR